MSEERLERIEGMLSQLIHMVGNMQNSMSQTQSVLKEHEQKFDGIELRLDKMEINNDLRHNEVINHIKRLEKDQDFIWEKAVRNERELEIMKRSSES